MTRFRKNCLTFYATYNQHETKSHAKERLKNKYRYTL